MKWIIRLSVLALFSVLVACQSAPSGGGPDGPEPGQWGSGDVPGHFPGRSGELITVDLGGQEFTYEVIDGLAIYQSDIILGDADEVAQDLESMSVQGLQPLGTMCDHEHIASGWGWFCGRWSDATVPYSITETWGGPGLADNAVMRFEIEQAIAHWEANTNLRFVPSNSGVRVVFRNGEGCSSPVGRQENILGGPQYVTVSIGCGLGAIIHEIGHAVGLWHEQSRNDRDGFVEILWDNIKSGKGHNFNQTGDIGNDVGDYDFSSIMHYHCTAFSVEPDHPPTINILVPGASCATIGRTEELSVGDIQAAYVMYPPSFTISGVAASYSRDLSIHASIATDRPVNSAFMNWFVDGTEVRTERNMITLRLNEFDVGSHTLEARMIIDGITVGSASADFSLTNVAPVVNVVAPDSGFGACVDQLINFRATVFDVDSEGMTLPDETIVWRLASGTVLGNGANLSASIGTAGTHDVTVTAADVQGLTDSDTVQVQVDPCTSTPPIATITMPDGDLVDEDAPHTEESDEHGRYYLVTLEGTATDAEDGDLSDEQLQWFTNRGDVQPGGNANLGHGNRIVVKLYDGASSCSAVHVIRLVATDSDGISATANRSIRVWTLC